MKSLVITRLEDFIEANEYGGVGQQQNAIFARDQLRQVMELTVTQVMQIESTIEEKELYDPAKDKFGFGPIVINATDMLQFLEV
ncbi:hypothetical protein GD1_53 [Paraglaciecola Antarctic GD virus 1]|nr:hypothetical protein GD1_53 [Paraglaciecola Antarctic GD virus 1]